MQTEQSLSKAEREAKQALENKRLGVLLFQISWIMAFVALIVVNWQLRFQYESWPPPGVAQMGLLLPSLATVALLASTFVMRAALRRVQADDTPGFMRWWLVALAMGVFFVGIMVAEWIRVPGDGTTYRTVFRMMTAFHTVHAVAIGAFMANIYLNTRHAQAAPADDEQAVRYGSENFWAVEAATRLWDFVAIAWILFYVVLYWWTS